RFARLLAAASRPGPHYSQGRIAEGLSELRRRLRAVSHRHRQISARVVNRDGKSRLGQTKIRQWIWHGRRDASEFLDLRGDGRAGRGEGRRASTNQARGCRVGCRNGGQSGNGAATI